MLAQVAFLLIKIIKFNYNWSIIKMLKLWVSNSGQKRKKDLATSWYYSCESEWTGAMDIHIDESYSITREAANW